MVELGLLGFALGVGHHVVGHAVTNSLHRAVHAVLPAHNHDLKRACEAACEQAVMSVWQSEAPMEEAERVVVLHIHQDARKIGQSKAADQFFINVSDALFGEGDGLATLQNALRLLFQSYLQELPEGEANDLLKRLAVSFLSSFGEVLKEEQHQRAWIAFQMAVAQRTIQLLNEQKVLLPTNQQSAIEEVLKRLDSLVKNETLLTQVAQTTAETLSGLGRLEHQGKSIETLIKEASAAEQRRLDQLEAALKQAVTERKRSGDSQDGTGSVTPGSVPPLPAIILGREEDIKDVKRRLLVNMHGQVDSTIQVLTAVRGWPGVGKTTLASAIAHDADMQAAFPDGILWTSLGQNPSVLSSLAAWGRQLGDMSVGRALTVAEASAQLAALLNNKRMLLIVDDVWEVEHALPFKVGGHGCAMLLTTREKRLADALAPTPKDVYVLKVLSEEAALELLTTLAPTVVRQYHEQCVELVQELEGLPLALQVAGHLLDSEASMDWGVEDLLAELRDGTKLMETEAPADRADLAKETIPTVAVLFQKSTDRLDARTRDCFAYLGAFAPKPATFDLEAAKAVWEVANPKPIMRKLVDRGLLEPVGSGRFQMHALLVMHACSLLT